MQLLQEATSSGPLIICEIVYVELAAANLTQYELDAFLADLGISLLRTGVIGLAVAGSSWRAYTQRTPRQLTCPACGTEQQARCTVAAVTLRHASMLLGIS